MAVEVEGLAEVMRRLGEFPQTVTRKALPKAARAAAKMLVDEAKKRAPVLTLTDPGRKIPPHPPGFLRDSIHISRNRWKKPGVVVSYSARTTRNAFYGDFFEFGFHHTGGKWIQHPFMRPALDARAQDAINIFVAELTKAVDKVGST